MPTPPANLPFEPVPPTGGTVPSSRPTPPPPPPPPPSPTPPPTSFQKREELPAPQKVSVKQPEDIFSNIENAAENQGPSIQTGGPGPGPLPRGGGGVIKTFLIILLVIVAVVSIGGGLFWYFVLRTPVESGALNEIPTVKTNGTAPVPTGTTPSNDIQPPVTQPTVPIPVVQPPVTEPPDGANIPPPTSITDNPPTSPATTTEPEPEVDSDGDGLNDRRETELGLNPNNPDTDGDGLSDGEEVLKYRTNPTLMDTDGDGYNDADEIGNGYNPLGTGECANAECTP